MSFNELLILPLPIRAHLHFRTSPFIYRNRKILKIALSFELLPQCRSLEGGCTNEFMLREMTGKLELGGSNPLPPTYSRLTGCAGYIFDCGDYVVSCFSV